MRQYLSKNVDEKPTWLWDILICSFFSLVKGATATTSSRLHHTSFYGDFDIYKVFSSDLSNAVGLHLRLDGFEIWQNDWEMFSSLDGFFQVTIQYSFSIYRHCQPIRKSVPIWIMQAEAGQIPIIWLLICHWPPIWRILDSKSGDIFTSYQQD